ncbi:MAG: tRNA (adenosine(37)-N6)-threonylcarbamoyltransferase complex dimerization subunit type 1 TsaB [Deltaproteobacteria bacterium]|nr:tRNA (adenosine(37)-N6)-threonylcarbamoyltransferase complex dimerization subunit type 1 TsaB [Deltaproteobacteria bacterium]
MLTLAFDTSSDTLAVALLRDETVTAELVLAMGRHHGETLIPSIELLLTSVNLTFDDVELMVLTIGPGSFTGLRIGVSTAKGFIMARDIPAVCVSTFEALAWNVPASRQDLCTMIDARQGKVYAAVYGCDERDARELHMPGKIDTPAGILADMKETTLFIGSGARTYADLIVETLGKKARILPPCYDHPRAGSIGLIGLKKFREGDTVDALKMVPDYLRVSYAG